MTNPIRYIINWFKLLQVRIIVNRYRPILSPRITLDYKYLLKRPVLTIIKVKTNRRTLGLLVVSRKTNELYTTYIEYVWVNSVYNTETDPDLISSLVQSIYEVFIQWHDDIMYKSRTLTKLRKLGDVTFKIAVPLNINSPITKEKFRRIFTLHNFTPDITLTLKDVNFTTAYRTPEPLHLVVYSKVLI